jgi:hypothetical protein
MLALMIGELEERILGCQLKRARTSSNHESNSNNSFSCEGFSCEGSNSNLVLAHMGMVFISVVGSIDYPIAPAEVRRDPEI